MTDDDIFHAPPNKLQKRANRRLSELNSAIEEIKKQLDGLEKLYATYSAQPKFSDMKNKIEVENQIESCELKIKEYMKRMGRIEDFMVAKAEEAIPQAFDDVEDRTDTSQPTDEKQADAQSFNSEEVTPSPICKAKALFSFESSPETDELSITPGDILQILEKNEDGWWYAKNGEMTGFIPHNYVQEIEE